MVKNIFDSSNFPPLQSFDADEVNDNLNCVKAHGKCLQSSDNAVVNKLIEDKGKGINKAQNKYLNYTNKSKCKIEPVWDLETISIPKIIL